MLLTDADRGRTIEVRYGETLTLRLPENPSTGYHWMVEKSAGLEQIASRFSASSSAVGSGGVRVIDWRVGAPGSFRLRLKNWREWEGDHSVIDRFEVTVVCR